MDVVAWEALLVGRDDELVDFAALLHRPEWHADAACREHPEIDWFPPRGVSQAEARAVCARCLVRSECAAFALADPDMLGVWAGTSSRQRRAARSEGLDAATLLELVDAASTRRVVAPAA